MKKLIGVLVALCLLLSCGVLTGCGGSDEAEPIVIGAIGPLTGENQLWGQILCEAVEMTAEEFNEAGGLNGQMIEVIRYDSRDDAVETTNAARKGIQMDGVDAFVGTESSTTTLALAEVCEEYGVPFVCTQATNIKITIDDDGNTRPYSFRSGLSDPQLGSAMAQYATSELGVETAAVIYNVGQDYSMGIRQEFINAFEANGGTIVMEEAFNNGDVDFRAILTNLKDRETEFDAIYIASGYYKEIGLICNQMVEIGLTGHTLLTSDGAQAPAIFEVAGDTCEGIYYPACLDIYNDLADDFVEQYIERWGWDPTQNAAADVFTARDASSMIIAAIQSEGSGEPEAIRDGLENLGSIEGVTGTLTIVPENHAVLRTVPVYQIQNQEMVEVAKFMPTA